MNLTDVLHDPNETYDDIDQLNRLMQMSNIHPYQFLHISLVSAVGGKNAMAKNWLKFAEKFSTIRYDNAVEEENYRSILTVIKYFVRILNYLGPPAMVDPIIGEIEIACRSIKNIQTNITMPSINIKGGRTNGNE